jgi:predicted DNA-binding transcriptional regulator AlpA
MNPNIKAAPRAVAIPSPAITGWMRSRVAAAGGDPQSVPDIVPYQFLRPARVAEICGVSLATVYRMIEDGTLPKPIAVDRGLPLKHSGHAAA